jgi:hypothetical protein
MHDLTTVEAWLEKRRLEGRWRAWFRRGELFTSWQGLKTPMEKIKKKVIWWPT